MLTAARQEEIRRTNAKSSNSYLANTATTPTIADISAGRNTQAKVKAYLLGTKRKVTPRAAVSAGGSGGTGSTTPNPVVYIGGDVGGEVAQTSGSATATGASDSGMVVKKKKLLGA